MSKAQGRLVLRAPNHLGDLVMALPAMEKAEADAVVVARGLAPLVRMADVSPHIVPIDRSATGMVSAARRLHRGRYDRGILLTPSFSSALLFRIGRVAHIRGSGTDRRSLLLDESVARADIDAGHRAAAYWLLVTGRAPADPPLPAFEVPADQEDRWLDLVGPPTGQPLIGLFPGSNASSRRWPPDRFAAVANAFDRDGARVVVFGGPAERELTATIASGSVFDAGGRTDLPLLAAGLAACDILITNDSGPMHLAAAVGTPTLALLGPANPESTGIIGDHHRLLRRSDLPCVPCVKNRCPRQGAGYILPEAKKECLNLIGVQEVMEGARSMLEAS